MENKDFIPYQEALALKELGFDEPCFAFYLAGAIRYKEYKDSQNKNSAFYNNTVTSIPLYQQAFRWFREKHKLGAIVSQFGYAIENENGQVVHVMPEDDITSYYEEAELACLEKLIEIVKNGK
jgi:hypothetical protein